MSKTQLVPFDERYLECTWSWLQDPEIKQLTMAPEFSRESQREWFAGLAHRQDYKIWGVEFSGQPIGTFGIKGIHGRTGEYWGYIGEKQYWGKGIGHWMMQVAREKAIELGLECLWLKVLRSNTRAVRLYKSVGFQELQAHQSGSEIIMVLSLPPSTPG
jgi:RimJ/RimL family protein N-acetyltransferase